MVEVVRLPSLRRHSWRVLSWQRRAKVLRLAGFSYAAIARECGVSISSVQRALDPEHYGVDAVGFESTQDDSFVARHRPRIPRQIIDRRFFAEAVKSFAAGALSREELMGMVTL